MAPTGAAPRGAQQHEDRRADVRQRDAPEGDVRHLAAVDRLDGHRRGLRVLDRDVLEHDVLHRAHGGGAQLHAVGDPRAAHVVAPHHDVAQAQRAAGLEADAVVAGMAPCCPRSGRLAVDHVDAVRGGGAEVVVDVEAAHHAGASPPC